MYETMHVALLQMDCVLGDKATNLDHALELAGEAVQNGANLILFPELFNTGYELNVLGPKLPDLAEDNRNHETIDIMRTFALSNHVDLVFTIPYFHQGKSGKPNISMFYMNQNGQVLAIQDKNHLFGDEKFYFTIGGDYPVFETRFGVLGMMVCYDSNFPEPARILSLKGAEVILITSAWREQDIRLWDMIMPVRAADNICYVVANNRYGNDAGRFNPGHSQVCDPEGRILSYLGECEGILYATLQADTVTGMRSMIPYFKDLRDAERPVLTTR